MLEKGATGTSHLLDLEQGLLQPLAEHLIFTLIMNAILSLLPSEVVTMPASLCATWIQRVPGSQFMSMPVSKVAR